MPTPDSIPFTDAPFALKALWNKFTPNHWSLALRTLQVATLCLALVGCVRTAFLPTNPSQRFEPTDSVEVFWKEPTRPYLIIGQVSAEAGSSHQERTFSQLKELARQAGAHAVIMLDEKTSIMGVPTTSGGTLIVGRLRMKAYAIRWRD